MSTPKSKLLIRSVVRVVLSNLVLTAILFGVAGRADWLAAWILTTMFFLFLAAVMVWALRNAPDLIRERTKKAANVETWDRVVLTLYTILLAGLLVTAALDAGRFRWSQVPPVIQWLGGVGFAVVAAVLWSCMSANAFLSSRARIQYDRGHAVANGGPYQYVRHSMYPTLIAFVICISFLLGSWWALIPAGLIGVLFVIRTALEERMLIDKLAGYREYTNEVRCRLLPGVW